MSLTDRLYEIKANAAKDSPRIKSALERIGSLLRSQMIINITRYRAIDTGFLRSSIRYEINQIDNGYELKVGSFGVPYAGVIEYGFVGPQNVKAHTRRVTKVFGAQLPEPRIQRIRAHIRFIPPGKRPARPFMRDAMQKHRENVIDILREELGLK